MKNILTQEILVFVSEAIDHILNLSGSMFDNEGVSDVGGIINWKVLMSLMGFSNIG